MDFQNKNMVLTMVRRALNLVDSRLVDHGVKVALVLQDMLRADGCLDAQTRKDLCILALFHDIGAYRTEEISRLVQFETGDIWEHSIYGYLFLKKYFPKNNLAKVVLYHHADYECSLQEDEDILRYAQMLHVADRVCIWHDEIKGTEESMEKHFSSKSGSVFSAEAIELYEKAKEQYHTWEKLQGTPSVALLEDCAELTEEEAEAYLYILVDAIDFRSRVTVNHTRSLMEISLEMARLAGLSDKMQQKVYYGALVHDLGKIGTPLSILEKPGRLTEEEMEIMKQHVVLSEKIIQGCVDEETAQIGLRHHEKLDGSGYPFGRTGEELTLPQRLMAVADIVSALCMSRSYKEAFSKEKCISILQDMSEKGQLDEDMVSLIEREFDDIVRVAEERCIPFYEEYNKIQEEFQKLMIYFTEGNSRKVKCR